MTYRLGIDIGGTFTDATLIDEDSGEVRILSHVVWRDGRNWLCIEVLDHGCGIAPEDLPFVFEHFYRADKARDKKSGGSGIGLAIVKRLTEIHGGFVEAHSEPGQGSRFVLYLPVSR